MGTRGKGERIQSANLKISHMSLLVISGGKEEEKGFTVCQICLSQ